MAYDVIMPQMGESIAEGTVTAWLKEIGQRVERDEPLFEISTDKVDAEIPSPAAGILTEIKVEPGQTVPINTVVAVIGAEGAAPAPSPAGGTSAAPPATPPAAAPLDAVASPRQERAEEASPSLEERRRTKSSPVVRKIAAEHGIEVAEVAGTGIGGRVTKQDILSHIEHRAGVDVGAPDDGRAPDARTAVPVVPGTPVGGPSGVGGPLLGGNQGLPDAYRGRVYEGDRVEEMSTMRAKIAEHMVLSRHISAHVATVFDVDFSRAAELRRKYKKVWAERHGVNLTFTGFIMKAAVDAIKAFPELNASIDGKKVIYHRSVNLGLAVALDWGLIVPVIHGADELNLLGLARRANDLAERARSKKLKPDEVQAGTFTITNPGIYGPLFGLPVINQPQVAIMGVGAIEKRPVVVDDMIAIRTKAYLSLSFDHRLIDGAVADQFMKRVKQGIEELDESLF